MNFCQKISLLCNLALWNLKSMEMLWILNLKKKNISMHINFEYSTTFLANCVNDYDISKGCTILLISSCTPMKQTWSRAPLQLYLDICYIFFFSNLMKIWLTFCLELDIRYRAGHPAKLLSDSSLFSNLLISKALMKKKLDRLHQYQTTSCERKEEKGTHAHTTHTHT